MRDVVPARRRQRMTTLALMQMRFEGNNRMAPQGSYLVAAAMSAVQVGTTRGCRAIGPQMAPASVEDRNAVPGNGPAELVDSGVFRTEVQPLSFIRARIAKGMSTRTKAPLRMRCTPNMK
jgi:hypothetical protein